MKRATSPQLGLFDVSAPDAEELEGPIVCRVPTPEEQRRFAEEFPDFVAPWPAPKAASPYHCESCGAAPGELHGAACEDAGARVPTVARQQALLRAAREPIEPPRPARRPAKGAALVRHIESAVRHGNLGSAREALAELGDHAERARLEQLVAAGQERDDGFDPWSAS